MALKKKREDDYFENNIPNIYRRRWFDTSLWAWCRAKEEEGVSRVKAIEAFIDFVGIDAGQANVQSLAVNVGRRNAEYDEMMQQEDGLVVVEHCEVAALTPEQLKELATLVSKEMIKVQKPWLS